MTLFFFCLLKLEYFTDSRVPFGKKLKLHTMPRIPLKECYLLGNVTFLATAVKPETFVFELPFAVFDIWQMYQFVN